MALFCLPVRPVPVKSSALAAVIDEINEKKSYHIVTIEDPIEFLHKHKKCTINQREVGADTKDFASALRAALRQAPKVILVGEIVISKPQRLIPRANGKGRYAAVS